MNPVSLVFPTPVSIPQLVIPSVCAGILMYGMILYSYMGYRFKSRLYASIALLSFIAFGFVGSETLLIVYGAVKHQRLLAVHFHRTEQLFGAYFLFALPYSLNFFLKMTPRWRSINRVLSFTGLFIAFIITAIAFIHPDLFISFNATKKTWLSIESDYGRGKEGIVYLFRDLFLALFIIYTITCFIIDIVKNNRFRSLVLPATGILIAIYGALNDTIYVYTMRTLDPIPDLMFSRFSVALTFMVLLFMVELMRRFINESLELEQAHRVISASEKRYRFIIEGTNDAIFALDSRLNFIEANRSALDQLAIDRKNPSLTSFYDIIHVRENDKTFMRQVVDMKIQTMLESGKPVSMKLELITRKTGEPGDYNLVLEHITLDDDSEILVKASREPEDTLKKYIDFEKGRFCIDNYLLAAEEISKRLVQNLPDSLNQSDVASIRLGVREILINAIEHGNLGITFEEKSQELEKGDYLKFLQERQRHESYVGRKIIVEFIMSDNRVAFKIADEGNGFDYRKILDDRDRVNDEMIPHGRGLSMAMSIFDEVRFNKKGNQVLLVKYLLPREL